ncbi:cobalt-precorrin-6Y C(5)-methyltransferase [Halodesulfurarchaeum formicicum]|uniref:Cobalt-precorrin-6Y C(5)-methyltransferase n=1 Tax=Halodesulfurarchaeum formicicum TaxID=1873524 RepID=A0A1D8S6P0_9EURY|nr:cobalt-precorrin-7 (C(5))-methyltransferase [Halodesulfurarchaeum formicicum]AOW81015.1 cobalt-precorrin-6Y C(5)-methyltransferase [Halodesulfurarchaeum formicicum]APE96351.1 cobalt-precorrin-7 (C5)-methyltransferase [Halodesulfurarchaeum formicicum]
MSEYDLDSGPDPADAAAAEPEDPAAQNPVIAVGIGPGNTDFLTKRGRDAIAQADVVVGFGTVVEMVAELTDAELLTCGYKDEAEALAAFGERVAEGAKGVAVLMGDPNHSGYQFLGKVENAVDRPVQVVPGISAIQVAASRARTPMEDTRFVTLHKSGDIEPGLQRLRAVVGERNLLVLPRPYDVMPGDIAADLLDSGADPELDTLVLEELTHESETVTRLTLGELAKHAGGDGPEDTPFSDLSVLSVRAPR